MRDVLIVGAVLFSLLTACTSADKCFQKGIEASNAQKYSEAIEWYEKATAKEPKNVNALYNAGIAYAKMGKDDKAIVYFERATFSDILFQDAWYNLAALYYKKGDYKHAVNACHRAGKDAVSIKKKSFEKLKESGFIYQDVVQAIEPINLIVPDFLTDTARPLSIQLLITINEEGKIDDIKCGSKDKNELCEYYKKAYAGYTFIPEYSFGIDEVVPSNITATITINAENKVEVVYAANVIMGSLDKEDIDKTIAKNLVSIRRCYEKELNSNHKLGGKIVVHFIISKTGEVAQSEILKTEMKSEAVETCLVEQIKKIKFPTPKGGGKVIVNYPFIFKNSEN